MHALLYDDPPDGGSKCRSGQRVRIELRAERAENVDSQPLTMIASGWLTAEKTIVR